MLFSQIITRVDVFVFVSVLHNKLYTQPLINNTRYTETPFTNYLLTKTKTIDAIAKAPFRMQFIQLPT
jgi:hypothetical protein